MKALNKAINIAGNQAKLAELLKVTSMAITQWKKRGITVDGAINIEKVLNGQVTREELRPDIFL